MAEEQGQDAADRSEAATPRRIERAREDGQVALSREAVGWAALLLATLAAMVALPDLGPGLLRAMRAALERSHALDMMAVLGVLTEAGLLLVLPVAGAAALGATLATLLQTRGLVSARPLTPSLDKINPWAGLKRLVGPEALAEFARTLIKLVVVGAALWWAVGDLAALQAALHQPAGMLIGVSGAAALRLMTAALIAFAAVAALDLLWVRFRHLRMLRMSRQDLREEAKESEGDPLLRARRRQMRERAGRTRMMAAVPRAAVVITNPTHYAVALEYAGGQAAPKVVAKGVDAMAARIREAATAAGVPLVSNPPLARALHRLELEAEIPAEHYQAVAEIIAFVWRRRGGQPGRSPLDAMPSRGGESPYG
jgi:flagellar biosynthetic protein FlhB